MGGVRRRKNARAEDEREALLAAKLVRSEHWHGLQPGDIVKVHGERGARFVFRYHVLNRTNGSSWVELDELALPRRAPGGATATALPERPVVRRQRSVDAERIIIVPRRARRQRSAPQGVQGAFDFGLELAGEIPATPETDAETGAS